MIDTMCTFCGQCVAVCPTGALTEMNDKRPRSEAPVRRQKEKDPEKARTTSSTPSSRM